MGRPRSQRAPDPTPPTHWLQHRGRASNQDDNACQRIAVPSQDILLVQALAVGAYALGAAPADLADNLAGNHLTHDGRHKAGGTQLGTLVDVGRVAGLGLNRFLAAKQHVQTLDSALLTFFAHDAAHGVTYRIENVGKAEALGMELVGPAHGANQTNVVVLSIFGNGELGRDGVDGVDDVVELAVRLLQNAREELGRCCRSAGIRCV